ncbi:MAG: alcohol dehydrogenase catalytic domain-containing protein [Planctomycetes bacterium]|nr:alcohol dehydrogenase catalytic domain-containing protein [Planctomycetota bacterium]
MTEAQVTVAFDALDYGSDQRFAAAHYRFYGDGHGWRVFRDGRLVLELGPGYRLLAARQCGVCSTDLARHHLPFPLPQVIGHEVLAVDDRGRRYVIEINASHAARGVAADCAFCRAGLATHCPDRRTIGIHDLPGGFGRWLLAPVHACLEVPAAVPDATAVLVEPFAAALHAARSVAPHAGERIAVLGPRRLGLLVVAAFAAERRRRGVQFELTALLRDSALAERAREFGADAVVQVDDRASGLGDRAFDVVVDTTGNPDALPVAVRLARREVHLKSTHGRPAAGLRHLTELVVDELALAPLRQDHPVWTGPATGARPRVAWLPETAPPAWLVAAADVRRGDTAKLAASFAADRDGLPRADVAVAASAAQVDAAIRPIVGAEVALVRPRGSILLVPELAHDASPLLAAVAGRGLVLGSSRCGDFAAALDLLAHDALLRRLGERLVTHRFAAADLPAAFATARTRACIKAVVEHPTTGGRS